MGRKIPGKKHKGVKDPELQQAQRFESIKDKINNPPADPDEQPIPKSLYKIMNFKKRSISGQEQVRIRRKRRPNSLISTEVRRNVKSLSNGKDPANFTQLPGESSKAFLARVNQTVKQYLKEAEFENKYGVNIKRNEETGQIIGVEKRSIDEFEQTLKPKRGKKKMRSSTEPELSKSQKRLKKLVAKQNQKELERIDEFAKYADIVPFGEVTHAPPNLPLPRKVSKTYTTPRPGVKDLLLKSTLAGAPMSAQQMISHRLKTEKGVSYSADQAVINKKGKRKDLPISVRRQLEKDQDDVMTAYRKIKLSRKREGMLGSG